MELGGGAAPTQWGGHILSSEFKLVFEHAACCGSQSYILNFN